MQIIEVLIKTTAKVRSIGSYMIKPNEKEEIFLSTHNDPGLRNMCDGGTYMNSNNENPHVGKKFQKTAVQALSQHFGKKFEMEKGIPIGVPAKVHKFDCASLDQSIVVECKCFTWTVTGNIPSAKMAL